MSRERVNTYYDWTGELSDDGEGGLVNLCRSCARSHGDGVQWAGRGHAQAECSECRASNDPAYSRQLDEIIAA